MGVKSGDGNITRISTQGHQQRVI